MTPPRPAAPAEAAVAEADPAALLTLHAWLSPAFPTGAFAWSHGLETARAAGEAEGPDALLSWIANLLRHGAARTDAILLATAFRDPTAEAESLALALQPSAERRAETLAQGAAFSRVAHAAWGAGDGQPHPLPIAVAQAARGRLPLMPVLTLYLQAFAAAQVSAALRLGGLGETDGQRVLAALVPVVLEVAAEAAAADPEDLGGACHRADLAAMLHETQRTRLFRS